MGSIVEAATRQQTIGDRLRQWRERRRMSQLTLALEAEVSARHLSFVETGRSRPSREMVLRLAEKLDIPLRERNVLLLAAGYAPAYGETSLDAPEMASVRTAMRQVLDGHEPYPAIVVDRAWNLIDMNASAAIFTEGAAQALLEPPVNALRLALHPDGIVSRILNLGEVRAHWLGRLQQRVETSSDPELTRLYDELSAYPCDQPEPAIGEPNTGGVVQTLRIRSGDEVLSFFSILATLLSPLDITIDELAIESFYPADARTADALQRRRAEQRPG